MRAGSTVKVLAKRANMFQNLAVRWLCITAAELTITAGLWRSCDVQSPADMALYPMKLQ